MRHRKLGIKILALRARISIPNSLVFFWAWSPPPDLREKKTANKTPRNKTRETKTRETNNTRQKTPAKQNRETKTREQKLANQTTRETKNREQKTRKKPRKCHFPFVYLSRHRPLCDASYCHRPAVITWCLPLKTRTEPIAACRGDPAWHPACRGDPACVRRPT